MSSALVSDPCEGNDTEVLVDITSLAGLLTPLRRRELLRFTALRASRSSERLTAGQITWSGLCLYRWLQAVPCTDPQRDHTFEKGNHFTDPAETRLYWTL
jgi:hypothetical protein